MAERTIPSDFTFAPETSHLKNPSRTDTFTSTTSMRSRNSQLDEGFSEETRTPQSESDMMLLANNELDASAQQSLAICLDLPVEQRRHMVEALIKSLPNSDKEAIGRYCEELTHFDPAIYLPNELMFSILGYLTPKELLGAGVVSRSWREKASDEKLWRGCFAREGWVVDPAKIRGFEDDAKRRGPKEALAMDRSRARNFVLEKDRISAGETPDMLVRLGGRKRKTEEAFSENEGAGAHVAMHRRATDVESMEGVESLRRTATLAGGEPEFSASRCSSSTAGSDSSSPVHSPPGKRRLQPLNALTPLDASIDVVPPMWRPGTVTPARCEPKISWPWLFRTRFALEKNWETDQAQHRFKMFSLPHQKHLDEGHKECVYTIQHTSRHLVSGSRDKTLRRWDLNTQRLIGQPLEGHTASVLCLQFDERPEQDIIVSGGSDAQVLIWRFSTGELLRNLIAHAESVLNLRFDDRYLVTCSKDKSIKVWNRYALATDSPLVPQHVLANLDPMASLDAGGMVREYSLMAEFTGHQAAVNAVMIHHNTVISASGDRTIKSWSIPRGKLHRTYTGHTKGIACVQFDGRRIVSGSSDNTVRIFDAEQQAEVGCLEGHKNLVRTVQARFGDLDIVTDEELEMMAKEADRGFFKALEAGMTPASSSRRAHGVSARPRDLSIPSQQQLSLHFARNAGHHRNAGSSRPEDMMSVGTKIPPGGGGSRWAKIVSGSYDETVIVWKRNRRTGKWERKVTLEQKEILDLTKAARGGAGGVRRANGPQAQGQGQGAGQAGLHALQQMHQVQGQQGAAGPAQPPAQPQAGIPAQAPAPAAAAAAAAQAPAQQQQVPNPLAAQAAQQPAHRPHVDNNRVFKLQFDARRLICCSQNKMIVGWDFANEDRELEWVGSWCVETS